MEAIFAIAGRREVIAPRGQNSWQQKQRMHFERSMRAFFTFSCAAPAGQTSRHLPQPTHFARSTCGRAAKPRSRKARMSLG